MAHPLEANAAFAGVFAAQSASELEKAYDKWADTYDETLRTILVGSEECVPTAELMKLLRTVELGEVNHVLDCGAGTGAAGPVLLSEYSPLESLVAFDLSRGMLDQAKLRGCYTELVQGCCPDMSSVPTRDYDLAVCIGTFTPNHAPPTTLPALVSLVRPGGHIGFSVRKYFFEDETSGFKNTQAELEDQGAWRKVAEAEGPYLPKEGVDAVYFVYQRM
eukprot:TRINITY_DN11647_c0_g1_i1.p1 TRINITY_DN11647_c0_g1~~TRINITY_DN11647_c0_g1_i1.p1  ORF type:complete len:239 (+),score=27.19 TRINITY_DN11647_c0_g1_i1:61-717(+)